MTQHSFSVQGLDCEYTLQVNKKHCPNPVSRDKLNSQYNEHNCLATQGSNPIAGHSGLDHAGAEEPYDHETDPMEWKNLASDPQYHAVKRQMEKYFPTVDKPEIE